MTLPASGPISMRDVNIELRANPESPLNMNHPDLRKIAGKAFEPLNSRISMADLLGRSHFTYEIYNQPMFVQKMGTGWRYCMGFKIIATTPEGIVLNRITAYDEQGEVVFDHNLRVGGFYDWMVTTNPQVGIIGTDSYDAACINNPTNVIYVGVRLRDAYSTHTYPMHKLVVWDTNNASYELYNHRNLVVTGTFNESNSRMVKMAQFWDKVNNKVTLVPPNI